MPATLNKDKVCAVFIFSSSVFPSDRLFIALGNTVGPAIRVSSDRITWRFVPLFWNLLSKHEGMGGIAIYQSVDIIDNEVGAGSTDDFFRGLMNLDKGTYGDGFAVVLR